MSDDDIRKKNQKFRGDWFKDAHGRGWSPAKIGKEIGFSRAAVEKVIDEGTPGGACGPALDHWFPANKNRFASGYKKAPSESREGEQNEEGKVSDHGDKEQRQKEANDILDRFADDIIQFVDAIKFGENFPAKYKALDDMILKCRKASFEVRKRIKPQ